MESIERRLHRLENDCNELGKSDSRNSEKINSIYSIILEHKEDFKKHNDDEMIKYDDIHLKIEEKFNQVSIQNKKLTYIVIASIFLAILFKIIPPELVKVFLSFI